MISDALGSHNGVTALEFARLCYRHALAARLSA
jgi:hypothetical protein